MFNFFSLIFSVHLIINFVPLKLLIVLLLFFCSTISDDRCSSKLDQTWWIHPNVISKILLVCVHAVLFRQTSKCLQVTPSF